MEWAQQGITQVIIQALIKAYQQKFFVMHTVHDLLWGYKDEIMSLIHPFKPEVPPYFGLYYGVSEIFFLSFFVQLKGYQMSSSLSFF